MKKILSFTIAMLFIVLCICSCEKKEEERKRVDVDYSTQDTLYMTDDNGDLSVIVDNSTVDGYNWIYNENSEYIECTVNESWNDGAQQHLVFRSKTTDYTEGQKINIVCIKGDNLLSINGNYTFDVLIGKHGVICVESQTGSPSSNEDKSEAYTTNSDEQVTSYYSINEEGCLVVELPSNPSTGYRWEYTIETPDTLEFVSEDFISDNDDPEIVGAGGTWVTVFKGIANENPSSVSVVTFNHYATDGTIVDTKAAACVTYSDGSLEI